MPDMNRLLAVLATVFTLAACDDTPTGGNVRVDELLITARDSKITITNKSAHNVFTFVSGKNSLAFVDWYPCVDDQVCPPIPPNGSITKSYEQAFISESETEAIVYWWVAIVKDGVRTHSNMKSAVVRVR
jgi:hypothetical protein